MIGAPLTIGRVSEVVPVAPRADVRAPLVMERLLPFARSPELLAQAAQLAAMARAMPLHWQRLISAELSLDEAQLIYERFVGVTLRDLCVCLRTGQHVLPIDVLRTVVDRVLDGLAALPMPDGSPVLLSDLSVGLGLNGRWCFSLGALNHWLIDRHPTGASGDPELDTAAPDTVFFMSPEAVSGRPETPASTATRGALLAWQLATGGLHPFRGGRHEHIPSIARYTREEVRVPLSVHPQMNDALARALRRGVSFARDRFVDLTALRAALDEAWPHPPASDARTFVVIASVCWPALSRELGLLKREPLLPVFWDGVWTAALSPERGLAVLEDQLLEQLEPLEALPRRGVFTPGPGAERDPLRSFAAPPRTGLLDRLIGLFRP